MYTVCKNADTSAFQTFSALAEEALAVRSQIQQLSQGDHPLIPILQGMKSSEAVACLLGYTLKTSSGGEQLPSEQRVYASINRTPSQSSTIEIQREIHVPPPTQTAQAEDDPDWDNDIGDALEAISGLPNFTTKSSSDKPSLSVTPQK
ncbi:MAG: hypothetical protein V4542_06625 [Pseudomonadota bacterium]